jgi:hypothetical protein
VREGLAGLLEWEGGGARVEEPGWRLGTGRVRVRGGARDGLPEGGGRRAEGRGGGGIRVDGAGGGGITESWEGLGVGAGAGAESANAGTGFDRWTAEALGVACPSSEAEFALGERPRAVSTSASSCRIRRGAAGIGARCPFGAASDSSLDSSVAWSATFPVSRFSRGGDSSEGCGEPPNMVGNHAGLRMQKSTKLARMRERPSNAMSGAFGGMFLR